MLARNLENLPAEICTNILFEVPDWPTLKAFISASPRYLQAYLAARDDILLHVICNQINGDRELLKLFHLMSLMKTPDHNQQMRDVLRSKDRTLVQTIDFVEARQIFKFEKVVDALVHRFSTDRLDLIGNEMPLCREIDVLNVPQQQQTCHLNNITLPISVVEDQRIRRAIHNVELYRFICHIFEQDLSRGHRPADEQLWSSFLNDMPHHELEEWLCITTYLRELLDKILEDVENDFVAEYKARGPDDVNAHQDECRWQFTNDLPFFSLEMSGETRPLWCDILLRQGLFQLAAMLPVLQIKDLPQTTPGHQRTLDWISQNALSYPRLTTIEIIPKSIAKQNVNVDSFAAAESSDESSRSPSAAYTWVSRGLNTPSVRAVPFNIGNMHTMRRWGYAIWDQARLQKLGVMKLEFRGILDAFHSPPKVWTNEDCVECRVRQLEAVWYQQGLLDLEYWNRIKHFVT